MTDQVCEPVTLVRCQRQRRDASRRALRVVRDSPQLHAAVVKDCIFGPRVAVLGQPDTAGINHGREIDCARELVVCMTDDDE